MGSDTPNIFSFSAEALDGSKIDFDQYKGKVLLIENVASLWGTTIRDYHQLNELMDRYGERGLQVLGFPCNQFGYQVSVVIYLSLTPPYPSPFFFYVAVGIVNCLSEACKQSSREMTKQKSYQWW